MGCAVVADADLDDPAWCFFAVSSPDHVLLVVSAKAWLRQSLLQVSLDYDTANQ